MDPVSQQLLLLNLFINRMMRPRRPLLYQAQW